MFGIFSIIHLIKVYVSNQEDECWTSINNKYQTLVDIEEMMIRSIRLTEN